MKKVSWSKIALVGLIAFTGCITCLVFYTQFMQITIDYFAFLAGTFLIVEGLYKIHVSRTPFYPDQLLRVFRVVAGTWIFVIHFMQFLQYRVFSLQTPEITIDYKDYFAFSAGIFLIVEGLYKIYISRARFSSDQFLRILRVTIGTCLITIHLLQFIAVGTL